MNQLDLSDFFKTRSQAQDFVGRLTSILDMIFENDFNFEKTASEQLGMQKKDKLIVLARNNSINIENTQQVKEFISLILTKISSTPVLTLTIAFEPNEQVLQTLSEWCMFNIGSHVIFDINIDTQILGGAEMFFNGKHANYSIKPVFEKISNEILTNRDVHPTSDLSTSTPPQKIERIIN